MLDQKKETERAKYKYQAYALALAMNGKDIDEELNETSGEVEGIDIPASNTAWLQG